ARPSLSVAGELLGQSTVARSVLRDGAVVDLVAESCAEKESTGQLAPASVELSKKAQEAPPSKALTRAPRMGFLSPALRRQLFDSPAVLPPIATEAKDDDKAPVEPALTPSEEPRGKVGLRLVADRAPSNLRWRLAVADETR
ncbi:unnamed protein product, partial [Symbiodinium pilosum]